MPVDERLVDADRARDLLHRGVLDAALVEEGAGRLDDLALALAPGTRPRSRSATAVSVPVARRHAPIIAESPTDGQKFSPTGLTSGYTFVYSCRATALEPME